MNPLPTGDLRTNLGTWAVPACYLPAVARGMITLLPAEQYDPDFQGQDLATTYFDTAGFKLRKARATRDKYLTVRLRCYRRPGGEETYAVSAKTEGGKYRKEVDEVTARQLLADGLQPGLYDVLPPDLIARLMEFAGGEPVLPVVTVSFRRYAVENALDRLTLDIDVATDTGKRLPTNVLEYKSGQPAATAPLTVRALRPMKLSKFLWAVG